MKKAMLFVALVTIILVANSQETATTESGKTVVLNKNGTWQYAKESTDKPKNPIYSFAKKISDDQYSMSAIVETENGKGEKVKINFKASVPKDFWDNAIKSRNTTDADFFYLVASLLTIKAQYSLKNTLSFQPFPNQFFSVIKDKFMSSYKMTGRNGYGNEVETSALVEYDPNEKK